MEKVPLLNLLIYLAGSPAEQKNKDRKTMRISKHKEYYVPWSQTNLVVEGCREGRIKIRDS